MLYEVITPPVSTAARNASIGLIVMRAAIGFLNDLMKLSYLTLCFADA